MSLEAAKEAIDLSVSFGEAIEIFRCPTGPAPRIEVNQHKDSKVRLDNTEWNDVLGYLAEKGYVQTSKLSASPDHMWVEEDYTFAPAPSKPTVS